MTRAASLQAAEQVTGTGPSAVPPGSASAQYRCLPGSSRKFTAAECDDIAAARADLVAGAADLDWGGAMYEGEGREVHLKLRPRSEPGEATDPAKGSTTIVDFQLAEEMAVALEGAAFIIEPAAFQRVHLAGNKQDLARWTVTPREGTGARSPGKEQTLFVRIKARARLEDGSFVDLETIPKSYPVMVTVKPLTWWRHFWRDLGGFFSAPTKALDELALLLAAIGAVGAAYWGMRKKLARPTGPSPARSPRRQRAPRAQP